MTSGPRSFRPSAELTERSAVRFICARRKTLVLADLTGAALKVWFEIWTSAVSWPLNVGGKPFNSLPAFVPVIAASALGHWLFWTLRPGAGRVAA